MRRVPRWMKNKTYSRFQRDRLDGQEVAGDHAAGLPAQELTPADLAPPRRRLDTLIAQNLPDRARRHPDAQADELTVDAPVAPLPVLAREPQHEPAQLHLRRRPARAPLRVCPATRNELA